jgi:hypothetical protein
MAGINRGRWTAQIEGDFVVFLIGARFDFFHLIRSVRDLGGRRGMPHMLDYLLKHPEKGLLAYEGGLKTIVQYWRSFEHLEAFAKNQDDPHLEPWRNFWRRVGKSDGLASGTRPISSAPVNTRPSTAICGPTVLAKQASSFPLPGTPARAIAFVPAVTLKADAAHLETRWPGTWQLP